MQNKQFLSSNTRRGSLLLPALLALFVGLTSFIILKKDKPVLYLIGDSTVRNGAGNGSNGQWGWGSFMAGYFDTSKIRVENLAMGGRSSRTFITEGRWDNILSRLKKGDYVLLQFGHNDSSPLDDTARARGTIKGIGSESKEIYNPILKKQEVVYSYGWYLRKYIRDAKAKGATPIVCSPIPRNDWNGDKVKRGSESYARWAREVAQQEGVLFIDLEKGIADQYDVLGKDKVAPLFHGDHTHTSETGARMNAEVVVKGIKDLKKANLRKFLK
ncbi:rhamnogalacturonan acetylesterase [Paraflavisolibacter sp. H34]|uniref:rhamnogalacturonan acetylesterase n=1 Tax=Huijunlia imazamoxiresistens TaxID=3127457 RepID=UPI003015DA5A